MFFMNAPDANLSSVVSASEATAKDVGHVYYQFYNSLPLVSEAADVVDGLQSVRDELGAIITKHGLADILAIRLVHKHFDMLPGLCATFQTIFVPGICKAIVMGPVKPSSQTQLLGKNFAVDSSGKWVAYELTTDLSSGGNIDQYPAFAKEAAEYLLKSGGAGVLGLSWEPIQEDQHITEFEFPEERSTIMIPAELFPADTTDTIIQTNWYLSPFNMEIDCLDLRSGIHYGCKKTRSGCHYGTRTIIEKVKEANKNGLVTEESIDDAPFWKALQDSNSSLFKIVDHVSSVM